MSPISDHLAQSLRTLTQKIYQAEAFLQKQPGAEKASVAIGEDLLGSSDNFLEVQRDPDGECKLCVRNYQGMYGQKPMGKVLEEYPVSIRIQLCDYIPDLIDQATSIETEAEVAEDAICAADSIEEALARAKGKKGGAK